VAAAQARHDLLATGVLDSAGPVMVWAIVLGFVFAECAFIIGLFLPGDSLLFAAGVVLAQQDHEGHAWALSVVATVTAIVGNQLGYYIGHRTGHVIITRRGGRVLNHENLNRARDFLDRRGFWAIVLARWIPWVRTLAPLIAGAAKMDRRRFLMATSIGGVAWVPTLVLLGYYAAGLVGGMPWLKTIALWLSVGFFILGTAYGIWRYRQEMHRPVEAAVAVD
jgi:membrane-associated protein